jgi:hypothetical protein
MVHPTLAQRTLSLALSPMQPHQEKQHENDLDEVEEEEEEEEEEEDEGEDPSDFAAFFSKHRSLLLLTNSGNSVRHYDAKTTTTQAKALC